jgi:pimeloyl-ACP methyl ester carboxylesterase
MIAAALGGRGASGHRGRSALYDQQLEAAMRRLLAVGNASCQSHYSILAGRRLHYLTAGSGEPLLLLHGAGGGAANWYRLIDPLSRRHRIIAPDLPGFGFSDAIDPVAPLGEQVADLLAEWLRSLGIARVRVAGTSFGGLVALRLAERIHADRIIVTDAVGLTNELPLLLRLATLPLLSRLVVAPTKRGTRVLLRNVLTTAPLRAADEAALTDYLYWSAKRNNARMMARAFTRFAGLSGQRDVVTTDQLRRLTDRLLLVWGEQDDFLPLARIERACALAGCSPVRIIPGAGHSPNWEKPDLLLNIIQEFLSE